MLATETYTLDGALADLEDSIAALEDEQESCDEASEQYQALATQIDRLEYFANGLRWQRDSEGWGAEAEIELGALTAGEKALMHREAPDTAGREEMRLWFVAASTAAAPYASDDLEATFTGLAQCHPAFAEWAEAQANGLGVPDDVGNGSSTSSPASDSSGTSTNASETSTSSSSDSPTA
jgi:hypothetical protein